MTGSILVSESLCRRRVACGWVSVGWSGWLSRLIRMMMRRDKASQPDISIYPEDAIIA